MGLYKVGDISSLIPLLLPFLLVLHSQSSSSSHISIHHQYFLKSLLATIDCSVVTTALSIVVKSMLKAHAMRSCSTSPEPGRRPFMPALQARALPKARSSPEAPFDQVSLSSSLFPLLLLLLWRHLFDALFFFFLRLRNNVFSESQREKKNSAEEMQLGEGEEE